jgi:membrane associated rhomboid family serine protease
MLIPLRHENMEGRRWPVVTFALIALNVLAFLGTHWTIEAQEPERAEVRMHLLVLAAMHPELNMPDDVEKFVTEVKKQAPEAAWEQLASRKRRPEDAWDAQIREVEDPQELQSEMDTLAQRFTEVQKNSILENYAFVPAHPKPISYLTSMFLHIGWLHLIGNMWFLWLAGFILEDRWGRVIYPIFYVLAGIAASLVHTIANPHSLGAALGASGAVAALMGGFLVRFPKLKIEMLWRPILFFIKIRFKAPAYSLLPLWLLMEIFYGSIFGKASGVAHWAHVGGFLFGAIAGLVISRTSLEHEANAVIENKIGWTADPAVVQGTDFMEKGKFDEGIAVLKKHLAVKPDAIDAQSILSQLYWRKNDIPAHLEATIKLCQLHLKAQDTEAALQDFQEYTNAGGDRMPAATWLELCRLMEGQQQYDRAVTEYEHLAKAYPTEKQAILALLSAGRLTLKQLNRPSHALLYYKAARASKVPHAEWDSNIQAGIQAAEKATAGSYEAVAEPLIASRDSKTK